MLSNRLSAGSWGTIVDSAPPNSPVSPRTFNASTEDINIKPTRVPMSPLQSSGGGRKAFWDKSFVKLERGSLAGSVFNLCSAALGCGVLTLPYVFALSGWALGFILLIIGALAAIWSNMILTHLATKHKLKNYDEICYKAGGETLRKFL